MSKNKSTQSDYNNKSDNNYSNSNSNSNSHSNSNQPDFGSTSNSSNKCD